MKEVCERFFQKKVKCRGIKVYVWSVKRLSLEGHGFDGGVPNHINLNQVPEYIS